MESFRRGLGAAGSVWVLLTVGLWVSNCAYSGGGVAKGVDSADEDAEGILDSELDPDDDEVDFFLRSAGRTIASWPGLFESAMITCATIGPRTFADLTFGGRFP